MGVRGFVPASLVETDFVEDFSDYKGKTLTFKIVELDKEKNRIILSHKAVKEEEKQKQKQQLLSTLQPGQVIDGTVQRITNFGAFVDIGGMDGLVHILNYPINMWRMLLMLFKKGKKYKSKY